MEEYIDRAITIVPRYVMYDAIDAGAYDYIEDFVFGERDLVCVPQPEHVDGPVRAALFWMRRPIRTEQVLATLAACRYRPANVAELLALGAEHPDEQRCYPIAALGSPYYRGVERLRFVLSLYSYEKARVLGLTRFDGEWSGAWRFLAVHSGRTEDNGRMGDRERW